MIGPAERQTVPSQAVRHDRHISEREFPKLQVGVMGDLVAQRRVCRYACGPSPKGTWSRKIRPAYATAARIFSRSTVGELLPAARIRKSPSTHRLRRGRKVGADIGSPCEGNDRGRYRSFLDSDTCPYPYPS